MADFRNEQVTNVAYDVATGEPVDDEYQEYINERMNVHDDVPVENFDVPLPGEQDEA